LENQLNLAENENQEIREKEEIIANQNQQISTLKNEIENLKFNFGKIREANSKLESELRENKKMAEQLKMRHDFEIRKRDEIIQPQISK